MKFVRLLLIVLVAMLLLAGCSESVDVGVETTELTTTITSVSTTTSSTTTESHETQAVRLFFHPDDSADCATTISFERLVPSNADPIQEALAALVGGPSEDEVAAGARSFFGSSTVDVLLSTSLVDGLLTVDFDDLRSLIPNASASCGSEALLAELDRTALQFETVERVRYEINGSCMVFANWLQRDCFESGRTGRVDVDLDTNSLASGSGCTPGTLDLPDGVWFGYVSTVAEASVSFDLACWFSLPAAADAAAEDGEESPPPNDYYIRNTDDRLRALVVSETAAVAWMPTAADPSTAVTVSFETWRVQQPLRSYRPGVWVTVVDGNVVSIEEQYVP